MLTPLRHTLAAALTVIASSAFAADYPNQPVRIVVPFAPGGLADNLARVLAERLGPRLDQSIIVDNRPGGNTVIAAQHVARAEPSGYTLLMATDATLSVLPLLYDDLPFDPQADFVPILPVAEATPFLVVSADFPANSVDELLAIARDKPGELSYASQGVGSNGHFSGELLNDMGNVDITHVPYKGLIGAVNALLGEQVTMTFSNIAPIRPHIESGRLKVLAYLGDERSDWYPETPTIGEAGYPGMESVAWFGLVAPAQTPDAILEKLADNVHAIVSEPEFQERFITQVGLNPSRVNSPAEFAEFLADDRRKYEDRVARTGITID